MVRAAALGMAAAMCSGAAVALPIDRYVTVQLIDVCDGTNAGNSTHCAPVGIDPTRNLYDYNTNRVAAVTEEIWRQAGISFAVLPTVTKLYNGGFLDLTVDGTPTDEAHHLFRDVGNGQNAASLTLNIFYVDTITATNGNPIYGYALEGSNGAAISAAAQVDATAHELGHNLGLGHVDGTASDSPTNLMRSVGRSVPQSLADITGGRTDQLYTGSGNRPNQVGTARQPLFTIDGASAKLSNHGLIEGEFYDFSLDYAPGASTEGLRTIKLRYQDARQALVGNMDDLEITNACVQSGSAALINGIGAGALHMFSRPGEFDVLLFDKEATVTGGLEVTLALKPGCVVQTPQSNFGVLNNGTLPFSVEFDFDDGHTSTGLYDATTDAFSTTNPITVGFLGQPLAGLGIDPPPELPHDPADVLDLLPAAVPAPGAPWLAIAAGLLLGRGRQAVRRVSAMTAAASSTCAAVTSRWVQARAR